MALFCVCHATVSLMERVKFSTFTLKEPKSQLQLVKNYETYDGILFLQNKFSSGHGEQQQQRSLFSQVLRIGYMN